MPKDFAIIYNPVAAAGKLKEQFNLALKTLDNLNVSYQIFKTEQFQHAITLARDAAKDGFTVVGVGGDNIKRACEIIAEGKNGKK